MQVPALAHFSASTTSFRVFIFVRLLFSELHYRAKPSAGRRAYEE
jgi:hypothetical protein